MVDRKDLDYQNMKEYDRFEKGAANSNTSTTILKRQLEDPDAHIIITTIQKLATFIKKNPGHEVYTKHIVIIFDECHRSQFGDMHTAIVKNFKRISISQTHPEKKNIILYCGLCLRLPPHSCIIKMLSMETSFQKFRI